MRVGRVSIAMWALVCSVSGSAQQPGIVESRQSEAQTRRIPAQTQPRSAVVGLVQDRDGRTIGGATITLTDPVGKAYRSTTGADGIFRIGNLAPGSYMLDLQAGNYPSIHQDKVQLNNSELLVVELYVSGNGTPRNSDRQIAAAPGSTEAPELPSYREISRRSLAPLPLEPEVQPTRDQVAVPRADRWTLPSPEWDRYPGRAGEYPYAFGRWWDPFNRNKLKGDYPILGNQVFFNFTGVSTTAVDVRRLYVPSGVAAENPGSFNFFGRGSQAFLAETVRLSFDLFHGDTAFKPADWRIKVTPAFNINQLWARERGVVNIDVREGTARTDFHVGLQEAFAEVKLHDLSPNYDFVSIRAGIQQFSSDFRGFVFSDEQPGIRVFGNLRSNRLQYNLAYFRMLEKDTNSGLNTFHDRHQQVAIANLYVQDFLTHGYTAQFSYHMNRDDASVHYDENGFLVRPAPIGAVTPHDIRAHYLGWTGSGHIHRWNVNHAFYQVLGHDSLNPVAGRRTDINAQFVAAEVSRDKDWLRPRAAFLFSSGDGNPRDGTARGFDSIIEAQTFAGGIFSFFNREGIRLTGTGVALTSPESFIPDLRSSKEEGQASYVNPGLLLWNAGLDAELTPQLKAIVNVNYMRFQHTEPLELLLFQSQIPHSVGVDYGLGLVYRPALSENMSIVGGVGALTPGSGLRRIYTSQTQFSAFSAVRFQF